MTSGDQTRQARAESVLRELWQAYDQLVATPRAGVCEPGCHACCSGRVLLTTLEGRLLAAELKRTGQESLLRAAAGLQAGPGPASTFNTLARLCLAGQEPPDDPDLGSSPGTCPLLVKGLCAAYAARPLACRVMASQATCQEGGAASQDPWWITVDTAFMQIVEQVDAGGGLGLLPRVLASLEGDQGQGLLICQNLPGLPAPPEHQERLSNLLMQVFSRSLDGQPLGLWINQLRG
jgi:Fe-S-cluster containining protein